MVAVALIHCNVHSHQALGIPTGPHGAFRDYQVDAITLKVSPRFPPDNKGRQHEFFLRGAQ